jgi:hypothetical protein
LKTKSFQQYAIHAKHIVNQTISFGYLPLVTDVAKASAPHAAQIFLGRRLFYAALVVIFVANKSQGGHLHRPNNT